jgi:hypothetical protein
MLDSKDASAEMVEKYVNFYEIDSKRYIFVKSNSSIGDLESKQICVVKNCRRDSIALMVKLGD